MIRRFAHLFSAGKSPKIIMSRHGDTYHREVFSYVFTLHTHGTTYQMKADRHDVLVHTYYGPRVSGGDLSYLIQYADRGFSPNPSGAGRDRTYSLDTTPQEYST